MCESERERERERERAREEDLGAFVELTRTGLAHVLQSLVTLGRGTQ